MSGFDLFDDLEMDDLLGGEPVEVENKKPSEKKSEDIKVLAEKVATEAAEKVIEEIEELGSSGGDVIADLDKVFDSTKPSKGKKKSSPKPKKGEVKVPTEAEIEELLFKELAEKHRFTFRGATVIVAVDDNQKYHVKEENIAEGDLIDGEDEEVKVYNDLFVNFNTLDEAVERAVTYLMGLEGKDPIELGKSAKPQALLSKIQNQNATSEPSIEELPYGQDITVKLWGRTIYTDSLNDYEDLEEGKVPLLADRYEKIRNTLATEYESPELLEAEVLYKFDDKNSILSVGIQFNKRG